MRKGLPQDCCEATQPRTAPLYQLTTMTDTEPFGPVTPCDEEGCEEPTFAHEQFCPNHRDLPYDTGDSLSDDGTLTINTGETEKVSDN